VLEAVGVGRRFGGVVALDDVHLRVRPGEVLAVVGENGAGKSTLMRILAGELVPDRGTLRWDGRPVAFAGAQDALRRGIALIHQEVELADNLDVAGAVMLGREPRRLGLVDRAALWDAARAALGAVGLDLPPGTPLSRVSPGRRQLVEIARALAVRARVLVMDEPTSSLSPHEARTLLGLVGALRARGVAIVYVSHRLAEVEAVADRAAVLRDGRLVARLAGGDVRAERLLPPMVGRDLEPPRRGGAAGGPVVLALEDLATRAFPGHAVSLAVRAGEIVVLAGLVGAGRSELLETVFGLRRARGGRVRLDGRVVPGGSPRRAKAAGLALVPEERGRTGLVPGQSVRANLSLARLARDARRGLRDGRAERRLARAQIERLGIHPADDRGPIEALSGGNQQKVLLGRWLATTPRALLLDEPTRGVDVASKAQIHAHLRALADEGLALLVASSEMEEILALADRVLVLHEGAPAGELAGDAIGEEAILARAAGRVPA